MVTAENSISTAPGSIHAAEANRPVPWFVWRTLTQIAIVAVVVVSWEFVPKIGFLARHVRILDPYYISSPTQVWDSLKALLTGDPGTGATVWPYFMVTLLSTVEGTAIGLVLGALAGLVFSNSRRLSEICRPFIVLTNSVPRIALIPISVVLFGPTSTASVVNVIAVVFFVGFFNAFEGGRSVKPAVLENARLLGASSWQVMRTIRLPMVLTWTFAAVPNAISFGLIVSVTTELLAGVRGMGELLQSATTYLQTSMTFAIVVVLSFMGLALYGGAIGLKKIVLRWDE
ncbi:ABC transporter permease subunit [Frankia sp. CNm7]|uniref:ABC transporter permease subunit n=1 Tax=Frankia nepalensis TaxID=1836974 RepID=A0A937RJI4_9ACTN|nr:ABC transporter permease subunit [Frankia nepalensis]MBL7501970.1 ABC transporter permease subunit [Frankia nepalensis]MBL7510600.1 ABC transporter permease subunit [Frankia nepalensis]MBL7517340.1 ABC transporter permease subunit [Frankia nepalensis]MBL7633423.1 ABC transporter permease subunit [Frankia nepalensis]